MSFEDVELPSGWRLVRTGDVTEVVGGGTPETAVPGNFTDDEGHPWITPADLTGYTEKYISRGRRNLTDQGLNTSSAKYMPAGTVLYSSRAPIGYVAIASNPVTTNQGFRSFVPSSDVDSEYLYYALKLLRPEAEKLASGTTFAELSGSNAKKLPLPLPSVSVQRQIVKLLDAADSTRASAQLHLTLASRALVKFRVSIVAAAASGRLTADWREENDSSSNRLTEELQSVKRRKQPVEPERSWLPESLPATWSTATLGLLVKHIEAGKSVRALGRPALPDEWGVIKVSAMSWGRFLPEENKAVVEPGLINPEYEVCSGDLLISRANTIDLVGATVLVKDTRKKLLLSDKSLRLVTEDGVDKAWLNYMLRSSAVRAQFNDRATGTSDSMRNLSQDKILMTTLPLPSTDEQVEIARRVEALMTVADAVTLRIESARGFTESASQSVLGKAFRGELALA